MLIGYARTSTSNQKYSLEDQIEKLTSKGCEKIFSEEISSVSSNRPEFEKSLEFARGGDTLVVTTLSRFARSISDLWKSVEKLHAKGVCISDSGYELGYIYTNWETNSDDAWRSLSV